MLHYTTIFFRLSMIHHFIIQIVQYTLEVIMQQEYMHISEIYSLNVLIIVE